MRNDQLSDKRKRSVIVEIKAVGRSRRRWGMSLQGNKTLWTTKAIKLNYILTLSVGK